MTDREEAAGPTTERGSEFHGASGDGSPGDEQHLGLASVVLATVGRPERLPGLIDAALSDPACGEVVVAVDGDDRATLATLEELAAAHPGLRFVALERRGQLAALDDGVELASGEIIVLLDDDVLPAAGTISGHVHQHLGREGLVVLGPMPIDLERAGSNAATRLYAGEYLRHVDTMLSGKVAVLDALWMGNMSLRRSDCVRVGLRSGTFREHYHQDRDVGYRLADAGLTGVFDQSLAATHVHHRSDAAFLRDARRSGRAQAALHREHPARLGEFSPGMMIEDLPPSLRVLVRMTASSPLADPLARAIMAAGRVFARLRLPACELACAKLSRRVMQYRGALEGRG